MKFKIIIDVINVFGSSRVYRKYKVVKIGNRDRVSLETISRVVSCRKFVFLRVDNGGEHKSRGKNGREDFYNSRDSV